MKRFPNLMVKFGPNSTVHNENSPFISLHTILYFVTLSDVEWNLADDVRVDPAPEHILPQLLIHDNDDCPKQRTEGRYHTTLQRLHL